MALLTIADYSTQGDTLNTKIGNNKLGQFDRGGVVQAVRFTYTNTSGGALADGSHVFLAKVGPCLILPNSFFSVSAFGASRTLDVGIQEFTLRDGTTVASDIDALIDGWDVSSAAESTLSGLTSGADPVGYEVTGQTDILAKVLGGTLPVNGTIKGILFIIST